MKKMEASLFLGVGKKYMKGGACLNQSGSSAEFKIDYVENQKRDAKKKKFKEINWNLNFALREIMKEASIIGESEDLTADNFPATFEVKVSKEEDNPDQMDYREEESVSEEKNDTHQSKAEFKSSNLLPKNCHINSSVQNQKPISLDSSECGPFNLKFKYTDTSEEVAVKYDNIKCVAKYSSESKKASCEPPSNCKKILVNMKSNLRKLYKCHEPLCGYFTLDYSNFKKHNLVHSKYKLKEGTDFHSVPHKMTRPEGRDIIGKEANHDEHNILHCFDGVDGNSLVDKSVQCSLCDFFCFTSVGLKRHYIRYHSNKETQNSSESLDYCEDECTNSSDESLDGEGLLKRCSSCSFESQSSSLMIKHEKKHHQAANDKLIGTSKNFKCFECDFETPHRITLVCHEKEHANFVNKVKIKNKNITHFARKSHNAPRKCTSTTNSLDLHSSKPIQDEQCCLKNVRLYDQQNVNSCLDEYQQFKSDVDFEEREEHHMTAGCKKRKNTSDEKSTMYRKVGDIYHCGSCSYITSRKYCINNHILTHSKEKLLKCGHSYYATNLVENLNQHELNHQKTKKYACELCDFKSNYFRDIRLHHKRSHSRYPS